MRIIRGKYGKRRFRIPASFKARPTTDMAKESLFNILENRLDWSEVRALDLFAGTGSMGFEMLSRGAASVTAVEKDYHHVSFIKKVAHELQDPNYKILHLDALKWLRETAPLNKSNQISFNFIFADPPYALAELTEIPYLVRESGILEEHGLLIVEHPKSLDFSDHFGFCEMRNYGSVHFSFFTGL